MSLATRCTACNTVFRVVQDQLKVSEGWVRCGRCNAVFNALEGLFDLEPAPAPAPSPSAGPQPAPAPDAPATVEQEPAPGTARFAPDEPAPVSAVQAFEPGLTLPAPSEALPAAREPAFVEQPAEPFAASAGSAQSDATPASRVDEQDRIDFADARFNTALLAEAGIATGDSTIDNGSESEPEGTRRAAVETPPAADEPTPEFLRKALREARWTSPRARWTLSLLSLALVALLGLQAALHYRDLVVTLVPESRPALQALCEVAACRIEALRRIDDIVIESSSLNALPGGEAVRLSVVLRNRGVFALAMPAIELTLTDAGGQMIARRILPPADFGVAETAVLTAASEAPLQLVLTTSGRRASGYTVEPFYP